MSFRASLKNLIRRDPSASLRERAAETAARLAASKPAADVTAASGPSSPPDPVLSAIEAVRECLRVCKAAQRLPQPPGELDPLPEQEAAGAALHASLDVLAQTVPATAQGCAVLARFAVEFHAAEDFAVDEDEHGQQHLRILDLIARSPALAAGAQLDQPPAPTLQPEALTTAILDLWRIWAADEAKQQFDEALQDRRFALIDTADRLPATPENIVPKALALAWLEYVDLWHPDRPHASYATDGRLALDIHAAAIAPRLPAIPPRDTYGIAERVDFAAATLSELRTLYEKARHLSDVAYAMASQGCCQSGDRSPFGNPNNRAGDLLHWLGDALTDVESAAADELQRRRPASLDDHKVRLAAIADRIIFNGDTTETATFIQELATFAAEQARG